MKLRGKSAVVTGASRGIGRAIAEQFIREGASVVGLARQIEPIRSLAVLEECDGQEVHAVGCDMTDREQVERAMASAFQLLGGFDILVNNAGGGDERTRVGDDDPLRWGEVVELNLHSVYFGCRAAIPYLRETGGGAIINVGSGMGHQPRVGNSSYNASKAAAWMLTRCLAMELWQDNICVNELIPGPVETDLTAHLFHADQRHPTMECEWVKRPEDVAPLAVFLASQPPAGPTGQSFSLARRPL